MADLMVAAGLSPRLQLGEFCWWYFAEGGGMAFYDAETAETATVALGRELHVLTGADDDPQVDLADASFLAGRLVSHATAIRDAVKAAHPGAEIEILLPFDVNYPSVYGTYNLGGRLLNYVNIPSEFYKPETAPFDLVKMEGLDFGSGSRDVEKARRAARWPFTEAGWPPEKCRYLMPVFNAGCPWMRELAETRGCGVEEVILWAWDQVCLFGWDVTKEVKPSVQLV
jgi:hypothetical protein